MTYYISPQFLNKLAVHITKNFLEFPGVRVPLILGIHGRKGEGKTFQCDLVFERMGIEVVRMSAGELESPDAGDPSRLVRLRYREAAELVKVRGKMAVLLINDLDAGAGRFDQGTQYTVNTQMVNGTLMNIADNPTNVQLPGSYDDKPIRRVPIIVTGNDFSTLYAPLIRDGRMEKFYWSPDRSDRIGIVNGIFAPDNLSPHEIEDLVDTFPTQAIDFYSALRSRVYDEQVQRFIHDIGIEKVSLRVVNSESGPPSFPKPDITLAHLKALGLLMVEEQKRIEEMRLVREYNQHLNQGNGIQPGSESPLRVVGRSRRAAERTENSHHHATASEGADRSESSALLDHLPELNPSEAKASKGFSGSRMDAKTLDQVCQLLEQGYRIGLEHGDKRRFRANLWQSCPLIGASPSPEARGQYAPGVSTRAEIIAQIESCLQQYQGEYIRLIGIDPQTKRRILETIIQRPNEM